jgi:uncharacterized protein YraI
LDLLRLRFPLAALTILALALSGVSYAGAAKAVTFTLAVNSAFLRSGPSLSAPRAYSIFKGQTFTVIGKNADAAWLRLDFPGATAEAWVLAAFGKVDGDLSTVPVLAATGVGTTAANPPTNPAASPATPPRASFTLTVKSAFARSGPSFSAPRAFSLFRGQTFRVLARSADGEWVRIDAGGGTWVIAAYGSIKGNLGAIPLSGAEPAPAGTPAPGATAPTGAAAIPPGVLPAVSARAREIYQRGLSLGNNPRAFSKIGDSNSVLPFFLAPFDNPKDYRLAGPYASLQETVTNFSGSFSRDSAAVHLGFSAAAVLDPAWADRKRCDSGESPLACEYRLHRPSLALISLGTNSVWQTDADYEAGLRRLLQFLIDRGVVPILSTKADNLEGDGRFNRIVIRLAQEFDLPLWNFQLAAQTLPNSGLTSDGYHLTWSPMIFTRAEDLQSAWQLRNLTALQSLDAVWRAVK